MDRWIKTEKRLPNYGFEAIICTSKHKVTVGHYSEDGKWRVCDRIIDGVILWQPLPPLPKDLPIIQLDFDELKYSDKGGMIIPGRAQVG